MTTIWTAGGVFKRNGYEARRQLNPEELESFLRPLYVSMLNEIGYVAAAKTDPDAVSKLLVLMKQKADETGVDYVDNSISAKGFNLGLSLACVRLLCFHCSCVFRWSHLSANVAATYLLALTVDSPLSHSFATMAIQFRSKPTSGYTRGWLCS